MAHLFLFKRLAGFLLPTYVTTTLSSEPKLVDNEHTLVQNGAKRFIMAHAPRQKRFTVSLDIDDYEMLRAVADSHCPPLKLQYVVKVAVKNLLERHGARQLTFPLDD